MGLRNEFATDKDMEVRGIFVEYEDVRIRVARAGGNNKKYIRLLERKTKPFRRAIAAGVFSSEKSNQILREVFAEAVVLDWQTRGADGQWQAGIDPRDAGMTVTNGELLPMNVKNIVAVFNELPDMFTDLSQQAMNAQLFAEELREEAAGNIYRWRFENNGEETVLEGWLCPALNLYYPVAPGKLYLQLRDAE